MEKNSDIRFETGEHSGDLRIVARGRDKLEALANASIGLVSQIVSLEQIEEKQERALTATGEDDSSRAIAFLNEIVFLVYTRLWLPRRVKTLTVCPHKDCLKVQAVLIGEPVDLTRHNFWHDIKAVTYHGFALKQEGDLWVLEAVCDL